MIESAVARENPAAAANCRVDMWGFTRNKARACSACSRGIVMLEAP